MLLLFQVYDADLITKDDFIGKAELEFSNFINNQEVLPFELKLVDKKNKSAGTLNCLLSFYGPPELPTTSSAKVPPEVSLRIWLQFFIASCSWFLGTECL